MRRRASLESGATRVIDPREENIAEAHYEMGTSPQGGPYGFCKQYIPPEYEGVRGRGEVKG